MIFPLRLKLLLWQVYCKKWCYVCSPLGLNRWHMIFIFPLLMVVHFDQLIEVGSAGFCQCKVNLIPHHTLKFVHLFICINIDFEVLFTG